MYGRTEDILEIQEGNLVDDIDAACSIENMNDDTLFGYTTLISKYTTTLGQYPTNTIRH